MNTQTDRDSHTLLQYLLILMAVISEAGYISKKYRWRQGLNSVFEKLLVKLLAFLSTVSLETRTQNNLLIYAKTENSMTSHYLLWHLEKQFIIVLIFSKSRFNYCSPSVFIRWELPFCKRERESHEREKPSRT